MKYWICSLTSDHDRWCRLLYICVYIVVVKYILWGLLPWILFKIQRRAISSKFLFCSQFGLTVNMSYWWMWTVGFSCHVIFGWTSLNTFWSIFLSRKFVSCRSFNRLQGSPLVMKLASAVGIIVFAVWGLGPLVRLSRSLLLHVLCSSSYFSSFCFLLFVML